MKLDASEIKSRAQGNWDRILGSLAPQLAPALEHPSRHVRCPIHGGASDFRVFKNVAETGGGICTCGTWPDGFELLKAVNDWSFRQALEAVAEQVLGTMPTECKRAPTRTLAATKEDDAKIRNTLNRFWKSAKQSGREMEDVLWLYFYGRGLRTNPLTLLDVRYHPKAYYRDEGLTGDFPAMLAMVRDSDGSPVSIHRTYLTKTGKKAPVSCPKKLMRHVSDANLRGAAIRLAPAEKVLAVAEGIETSIAVMEMTGMPCWCVMNAGLMEHFVPPAEVEHLYVFADKDRPSEQHPKGHGLEAAEALATRLQDRIEITVALPPLPVPDGQKGIDWLDIVATLREKP